jgi:predicted phage terminase large subunit-like protein
MPKIQLSQAQSELILSKTKGTIFLSGIGCGKSHALILKSILLALEGKRGLFLSYSLNNLRDNLVPLYREILNSLGYCEYRDFTISKAPAINVIIKGVDIMLRTASDPNSLRGPSVSFVIFEEARELTREAFDVGLGRLRKGNDLQWFIASTTKGRDWQYDILDDNELLGLFDNDCRFIANKYITAIRAITEESPHLSDDYINELKRQYSSSFAAQELRAEIVLSTNSILQPDWFRKSIEHKQGKGIRFWDLAVSTSTQADNSAGALVYKDECKFYINDIKKLKLAYPDLKKQIIKIAYEDTNNVVIGLEEAGQQRAIIDDLRRDPLLSQFTIKTYRPTKDKVTRAYPFASQSELGNVYINNAGWNRFFFDECNTFGSDKAHDDMIDAVVGAYQLHSQSGPAQIGTIGH